MTGGTSPCHIFFVYFNILFVILWDGGGIA